MTLLNLARGALGVLADIAVELIAPRRRNCYWGGRGCFTTRDARELDWHHNTNHRGDTPRTKGYAR